MNDPIDLDNLRNEIEKEISACIGFSGDSRYVEYESMFTYQMDWETPPPPSRGKRLRPQLVLLTAHAVGGNWKHALPAAASIELVHNFSLIHDDIQDRSTSRRGKETIWVRWGEPLAINAGDAVLTLASLALQRLQMHYTPILNIQSQEILQSATLALTKGQFLDISFEKSDSVSLDDYWEMISGKTCSLLAAALEVGGLLGGAAQFQREALHECGIALGKAFQIQDDWLGIWGESAITGKSNQSDLLTRKKSYPILAGINKKESFYELWNKTPSITLENISDFIQALEVDDIKKTTEEEMQLFYRQTLDLLDSAQCRSELVQPLKDFIIQLVGRNQ